MELLTTWARGQWDRIAAWAAFGLAALLLLLGWLGTSDSIYTTQQIPYLISGGCGGLLLCAIGATFWLSADLRDEWRKLDEIHDDLRLLGGQLGTAAVDHVAAASGNGTMIETAGVGVMDGAPPLEAGSARKNTSETAESVGSNPASRRAPSVKPKGRPKGTSSAGT